MTGHVAFLDDTDQDSIHEGAIKIETVDETTVRCLIGFLQSYHKYDLSLHVPIPLEGSFTPSPLQPFAMSLNSIEKQGDSSVVHVTLKLGHLKGIVEDEIIFNKDGVHTIVIIRANVLGPDEGTPYLKSGIRMLEALPVSDCGSEAH